MGFYKIGYIIGISRVSWENESCFQKHYVILWDFVRGTSDLEKERKKDGDQKEKQRQQENKKRKEEKKKKKDDDVQIFSYNRFIIVIKIETVISNCKYFILF